jgi:hypothetical protein
LDDAGVVLTPSQISQLVENYKHENGLDVRYRAFCDDVDAVFTVKGLEKDPTFDASTVRAPNARPEYGEPLSNAETNELAVVIKKLAGIVKIEGTIIKVGFGQPTNAVQCSTMPPPPSLHLSSHFCVTSHVRGFSVLKPPTHEGVCSPALNAKLHYMLKMTLPSLRVPAPRAHTYIFNV